MSEIIPQPHFSAGRKYAEAPGKKHSSTWHTRRKAIQAYGLVVTGDESTEELDEALAHLGFSVYSGRIKPCSA